MKPMGKSSEPVIDTTLAEQVVDAAIRRYFERCRERLPGFVARHYGLVGSMRLNRHAFGLDLLRAPINVMLVIPTVLLMLLAGLLIAIGLRRFGLWLGDRNLFLQTAVAREIEWLIHTELLRLPIRQRGRESDNDALADEILADPRVDRVVQGALAKTGGRSLDDTGQRRLKQAMAVYTGSRAASADITNMMVAMGAGALLTKQMTLGALSLGPIVAGLAAHEMAVARFPLGRTLGGIWYGWFPADPSTELIAAATAGVVLAAACIAAFSGFVTDPVQRLFGLHRRRLGRMLDSLERGFLGDLNGRFKVRDHYVSRLGDLADVAAAALRHLG